MFLCIGQSRKSRQLYHKGIKRENISLLYFEVLVSVNRVRVSTESKMYPKSEHGKSQRASRPAKRRFQGNQYSKTDNETEQSATAKKLSTSSSDDIIYNPQHTYRIVEFFTVFSALAQILICKQCKQKIQFEESGIRGFGFKLIVKCACGRTEINSGPLIHTGYEINRRIVL